MTMRTESTHIQRSLLTTLLAVISGSLLLFSLSARGDSSLASNPEVGTFIAHMTATYGFPEAELNRVFARTRFRHDVIEAITRPAERKPWYQYRPIFLTRGRIEDGVRFWKKHRGLLDRASSEYGVPAEIIVAIIGVETRYGRHTGKYRVIDSLATLAFEYPPRSAFFRQELEQFLLLAREEKMDPLLLKGSYAGAMGMPQFIASSFRSYAVDFDGDGRRDIWNNPADSIGSIANYFRRHGWIRGGVVATRAEVENNRFREILDDQLKPNVRAGKLSDYGVRTTDVIPATASGRLFELETEQGHEYWVGLENFYTITRYNHSALYSMAVYQLSREIMSLMKLASARNGSIQP